MTIQTRTPVAPKYRSARVATIIGFALLGGMQYTWSTGVSAFRFQLGLSGSTGDLDYGMIVFGIGLGGAIGSFITGILMDIFGARRVVRYSTILYPISLIALGFSSDFWFAMSMGLILGLLRGATETAFNAHGVQVERFYGRPIMSNFHACSSLGGFLLGMVGSYFADLNPQSATVPFMVIGIGLIVVSFLLSFWILDKHDVPDTVDENPAEVTETSSDKSMFMMMFCLGLLWLAVMVGEGSIGDWGQEYFHRVLNSSTAFAGVAISCFTGAGFLGRLCGDRITQHFGRPQVMMGSGLLAIVGLLVAKMGTAHIAMVGLGLFGLGMACLGPLLFSAAGRKDPKNAGRNIGIVNTVGFSGMLAGPAGIALIVTHYSLSVLLYVPLVLMVIMAVIGPILVRDKKLPAKENLQADVRTS